jgi:ABC-type protease/lipase transport system fused ATPase/permease subunit
MKKNKRSRSIPELVETTLIILLLALGISLFLWKFKPQVSTITVYSTTEIIVCTTTRETVIQRETVTVTEDTERRALQAEIERRNRTNFRSVNEYIKSTPRGWTAEEMAHNLTSMFWVETKIIEREGVKYLFLRFLCGCCPEWWWVTWQGLKPANLAPVHQ